MANLTIDGAGQQIKDTNGNELLKLGEVASAVNQVQITNAATGGTAKVAATGDDSNIGLELIPKGTGAVKATGPLNVTGALDHDGSTVGFYGVTPASRPAALTQTYSTADRTLSAYTPDPESSAYTGAADSEAKLADLNSLRVAYENLRAFTEDLAQLVNALIDDLQLNGLEQ